MKTRTRFQKFAQKIHNQSNLHEYDLFLSRNNEFVQFAFMIKPGIIEIISGNADFEKCLHEVQLAEINYEDYDSENQRFSLINYRTPELLNSGEAWQFIADNYADLKNYMIVFRNEKVPVILDPKPGGIIDTYYNAFDTTDFGVKIKGNRALFKLWSPPAGKVELVLFSHDGNEIGSSDPILLTKGERGVWTTEIASDSGQGCDLEGMLYQYRVFAYGKEYIALDPYACAMETFNPQGKDKIGKGVIVNLNSPKALPQAFERSFSNTSVMANSVDLIAWEVHVRDFTIQPGCVTSEISGTYPGFSEKASYLKELGITHVQLMPVMKFYTVNESDRSFSGKDRSEINYNWGYDPLNYFTPEGWFSTDPDDPCKRIYEFRTLIQTLHNYGIGVILDVVYNHTHIVETFENIAPGCYYRLNDHLKISGHSGAGPSLESRRPMVRRLIIDSMLHFIREYHVDGFRFDLMSFFDHETMLMIHEVTGKAYDKNNPESFILQGEAWMFSDLDVSADARGINAAVTKLNYPKKLKNLGIFNDVARDSICGREMMHGFVHGNSSTTSQVASAVSGGVKSIKPGSVPFNHDDFYDPYSLFANTSANCINFLSIHDGLTLWDKIRLTTPGMSVEERALMMRMASLILFTSAGKIILHGGDEILRTKPLSLHDKEKGRVYSTSEAESVDGVNVFHENSYCSADFTNMIRWDRLVNDDYAVEMYEYYKGLILMRRSFPAFRSEPQSQNGANLRFLTSNQKIGLEMLSQFTCFNDPKLNSLTIRFINGPPCEKFFIAGEVHGKGISDNPDHNPFHVRFDHEGNGGITFSRIELLNFDLGKWGNERQLDIKLVKTQNNWESIPEAYSDMGCNTIDIRALDQTGCVTIDLSIKNYSAVPQASQYDQCITYLMDNNPDLRSSPGHKNYQADKVLVIHNPSNEELVLDVEELQYTERWDIVADVFRAGNSPLIYSDNYTPVRLQEKRIIVSGKYSVVIVRRK